MYVTYENISGAVSCIMNDAQNLHFLANLQPRKKYISLKPFLRRFSKLNNIKWIPNIFQFSQQKGIIILCLLKPRQTVHYLQADIK